MNTAPPGTLPGDKLAAMKAACESRESNGVPKIRAPQSQLPACPAAAPGVSLSGAAPPLSDPLAAPRRARRAALRWQPPGHRASESPPAEDTSKSWPGGIRGSCYAPTLHRERKPGSLSQDLHSASIAGVAGVEAVAAGAGGAAAGSGSAGTSGVASSISAFGACPRDKLGSVRVGVATRASWSSSSSSTISAQLMEFNRKRCPGRGWLDWLEVREMRPSLSVAQARRLTLFQNQVEGKGFPIFTAAGARAQQDRHLFHTTQGSTASSPQHLLQPMK